MNFGRPLGTWGTSRIRIFLMSVIPSEWACWVSCWVRGRPFTRMMTSWWPTQRAAIGVAR